MSFPVLCLHLEKCICFKLIVLCEHRLLTSCITLTKPIYSMVLRQIDFFHRFPLLILVIICYHLP